ncbi:DUF5682 family protein [Nonomuraea soli]|uniref:Uncharacterized protein n=1 Tax=Nonomuraea soli TaxID=1032476 RepID=A0A7W0CH16_9ACTN|nr:DUF5682 family protein [Nonomuraea soli]MBA2891003.1 hypothetical protein [Nonomuraea soli]
MPPHPAEHAGEATPGGTFTPLRDQLAGAAAAFASGGLLPKLVDDVERAMAVELEIFPVCHHSPASALAMARRLRAKQPKVIYLELCEDLRPVLEELRNCKLPVALQAFATQLDGFPPGSGPLSVIAPITEASAEYQAISYALDTPGVELVLVDRSSDHVFQWEQARADARSGQTDVGIEIGDLRPRFAELEEHLLHHGKVRHWSEWWDQYVEQPLSGADYDTYRQVMVLIGSLFRRLRGPGGPPTDDEDRERYMWTRMREHLRDTGTDPADCLYVCGAFHAASPVMDEPYEITGRTATRWLYGLIPSSHSAIERQFGLAGGSVSIAAATWAKALRRGGVKPYRLSTKPPAATPAAPAKIKAAKAAATGGPANADMLTGFLASPPALDELDEAELLGWCVDLVRLARRNGYLASTADAIAVYETSILLAGMRNRVRPTPYDFQDAAVTCIEKDVVPGRRDVRRLCEILLGGDRFGQVGYHSLPPLAQDVFDRLEPLGLDLSKRTIHRALLDLNADPQLVPVSHLLWLLRRLLPADAARPIMGSRRLGERSHQESWDLALGRHQREIIELGYEAVTVEQVLEQRLRKSVSAPDATAARALEAVEDAILFLGGGRLAQELGARAVELLAAERTVDEAPDVLRRIRRLLAFYRSNEPALPEWCERFVTAGYAHYCTLLPTAFVADDTGLRQVAAMLGFLFTMENLALSLGCDRAQLELAVKQSHPESPAKVALLWAAQTQLGILDRQELRRRCDELLAHPLVVPTFPQYLSGFVQALDPVPSLGPFVVEVISKAFARLPDDVLLPWLPKLITTLRDQAGELLPVLIREAGRVFPGRLATLDQWTPPWHGQGTGPGAGAGSGAGLGAGPGALVGASGQGGAGSAGAHGVGGPAGAMAGVGGAMAAADGAMAGVGMAVPVPGPVNGLLAAHPATADAVAALLGAEAPASGWEQGLRGPGGGGDGTGLTIGAVNAESAGGAGAGGSPGSGAAAALVAEHPRTAEAVADLVGA